jgi:hypothetical protein
MWRARTTVTEVWNFFINNGVGQNITASALTFTTVTIIGRRFLLKHFHKVDRLHQMVTELHEHHIGKRQV